MGKPHAAVSQALITAMELWGEQGYHILGGQGLLSPLADPYLVPRST